MNTSFKLKAIALFVSSMLTGASYALDTSDNSTMQDKQDTIQTPDTNTQPLDDTTTQSTNSAIGDQTVDSSVSDQDIKDAIQIALSEYSSQLDIKVTNNIVYLTGDLPSDTDYEKVVTIADSTKGVQDVNVDDLTVKDSEAPLKDTYTTAKVKGALIQADVMGKDLPSWTVDVETKNGTVYLSGSVASQDEADKVLDVVKNVSGVQDVDNQLVVSDSGTQPPATGQTDDNISTTNDTSQADSSSDTVTQ